MNTPKQYNIKVIPKKWWQIEYKVFLWYDKEDAKKEASSQWYQIISEDKDIQAVEYWKNDKPLFYSKKITKKDILLFFELFSNLTNLPPLKQVEILKKQTKKFIMKLFYDDLTTYISKWKSLHDIIEMPKWKKFFSHNQVELIKVWENTQNLDETIRNLAEEQKNELEIKSALIMAAVYPLMILTTLILASFVLFIFILPQMMVLTWWMELPPLTQILFDIRWLILNYWYLTIWLIITVFIWVYVLIQWYQWRFLFHRFLLMLPWVWQLLRMRTEMQISKILEFSSKAWMQPDQKLELLLSWVNNLVYKEYFKDHNKTINMWWKLINIFSNDKMFSFRLQWYIETWDLPTGDLGKLMKVHYDRTLVEIQKVVKLVQTLLNTIIIFILWWVVWLFAGWILQLVLKMTESVL